MKASGSELGSDRHKADSSTIQEPNPILPVADEGRVRVASRRRRKFFIAILLALICGCVEIASCIGLNLLNRRYPMDPFANITPDRVEGFLAKHYDVDLGWSPKPNDASGEINALGARGRIVQGELSNTISTYGDSYTFCDGVAADDAWPTLLGERMDMGVLNFGVGGYGTDQALMRLEKMHTVAPSRVVVLGIQPENINRIVSVYRGFYQGSFGPPKPFFLLNQDDVLERHNPFASPDVVRDMLLNDRRRLLDIARVHDRWYQEMECFGRPWSIRFPYSFQMALRAPFLYRRLRVAMTDVPLHAALYNNQEPAFRLMKAIVRRFAEYGRERGFDGVVLILPPPRDVAQYAATGERNYQPLNDLLRSESIPHHDMIPTFAKEPDLYSLYVNRSGHYSRKGNEIIAREVAEFLAPIVRRTDRR